MSEFPPGYVNNDPDLWAVFEAVSLIHVPREGRGHDNREVKVGDNIYVQLTPPGTYWMFRRDGGEDSYYPVGRRFSSDAAGSHGRAGVHFVLGAKTNIKR